MRQVLQSYRTGELWLADVAPPGPAPLGARVETRASLVSAGTEKAMIALAQRSLLGKARARPDLVRRVWQKVQQEGVWKTVEQVKAKLDQPVALGYSCAGVVRDALGADALRPGMRVACAGAGFASHSELNWVPRNLVVPLPEAVSFEHGATATVGAIALQGVRQAGPRLGDRIVVIGLGLIGNLAAQLARASGARVLGVDLSPGKVALALETGCFDATTDLERVADRVAAFTGGHGADAVILAAGAPNDSGPIRLAIELARLRGKIVVLGDCGMDVPRNEAYLKELDIRLSMSYGPGRYDPAYEERGQDYPYAHVRYTEQRNLAAYLDAVADGAVVLDPLLTHRFEIGRALDAYELIQTGSEPYVGVLLTYGASDDPELAPPTPRVAPGPAAASAPAFEAVRGPIGVGMVGAGNYARAALIPPLKASGARMIGVVNRSGPSADQARAAGGFAWADTDLDRLLGDPAIHAVFVGTRHDLHAATTIALLDAGKHVFVEKPLCLTDDELAAVAAAQARAGRYVQVGTNRRFSPYTEALVQAFTPRADPLTITVRVNAGRIPVDHWLRDPAVGGGRLLGEGIHWVDLCQALAGAPVRSALATPSPGGPTSSPGDTWTLTLAFTDGSIATIVYAADGPSALPKERVEVIGVGRAAEVDNWSSGRLWTGTGSSALRAPRGQQKGTAEQLTAFLEALASGRPAVPLDTTWHVQHVGLSAVASLADGLPRSPAWPRPAP